MEKTEKAIHGQVQMAPHTDEYEIVFLFQTDKDEKQSISCLLRHGDTNTGFLGHKVLLPPQK